MQGRNRDIVTKVYAVALGANLRSTYGTAGETLKQALKLFSDELLEIQKCSSWYKTPALPAGSGPDFVNAVVIIASPKTPAQVLAALHRIEHVQGRTRTARWEARLCDLDLLYHAEQVLPDIATFNHWKNLDKQDQQTRAPDTLILPHPRIQDRAFVLVPLNEIAPEWHHPVTGMTPAEMLSHLPATDIAEIRTIPE